MESDAIKRGVLSSKIGELDSRKLISKIKWTKEEEVEKLVNEIKINMTKEFEKLLTEVNS